MEKPLKRYQRYYLLKKYIHNNVKIRFHLFLTDENETILIYQAFENEGRSCIISNAALSVNEHYSSMYENHANGDYYSFKYISFPVSINPEDKIILTIYGLEREDLSFLPSTKIVKISFISDMKPGETMTYEGKELNEEEMIKIMMKKLDLTSGFAKNIIDREIDVSLNIYR